MKRLAIITTHPIQYNAPFFRTLAQSGKVAVKVFYTWDKGSGQKHDPGFGQQIAWDIPLLEGYDHTFVKNTSNDPGSHHFQGIRNPTLINEIKTFQPDAILVYGWSFHSHLQAMRHFKGKVPVWFRGDSTLLDYDYQSLKDVFKKKAEVRSQEAEYKYQFSDIRNKNTPDKKDVYESSNKRQSSFKFLLKSPIGGFRGPLTSFFKFSLRRLFLTWVYRHIDKAFYVGTHNKNYYLAHGVKEEQLVWMPHAVDNEFFQKDEEKAETEAKEWRTKLGIREDEFVVLFAGKFEPKKNPELLVRAVIEMNEEIRSQKVESIKQEPIIDGTNTTVISSEIKVESEVYSPQSTFDGPQASKLNLLHSASTSISAFPNQQSSTKPDLKPATCNLQPATCNLQPAATLHLILVGSGILETQLHKLASDWPYIHFLPFQNQTKMPVVYRLGNIFCLASQSETWGLAVNEALACGRPVVASTKVGCAIDLMKHGETGFIFRHHSIEDLKDVMAKSINAFGTKGMNVNCKNFIKDWSYKISTVVKQFDLP